MREDTLRATLDALEGEAPSPAFLTSLAARIEAEAADAVQPDLPQYLADPAGIPSPEAWAPADVPSAARRWALGAAAAVVVVVAIVGLVVVDTRDDGADVATSTSPGVYTAEVLSAAVIREGDGDGLVTEAPTSGLGLVLAPWFHEERSALRALGFIGGRAVPFDLDLPGDRGCADLLRDTAPEAASAGAHLPCGGVSAAQLFPDAASASRALEVFVAHVEAHSGAIYQVGFPLERTVELEADLGDEADASVLETFMTSREAAQVVLVIWRTDNLLHLVWDIQLRGAPGGVQAVMAVAEAVDNRTAGERPFPVEGD